MIGALFKYLPKVNNQINSEDTMLKQLEITGNRIKFGYKNKKVEK